MQTLIPTEIYDESENLLRIEFYDLEANFIFQMKWDEANQPSPKNQETFRKESYEIAISRGYELIKYSSCTMRAFILA